MSYLPVNYTTPSEVIRNVPAIGSMSNVDSGQIMQFIGETEAKINAKLSAVYSVPITPTPPLLQVVATDLTAYRIMRRARSGDALKDSEWPTTFKEANKLLDDIVEGTMTLVNSAGMQIDRLTTASPWSNTSGYVPTFDVGPVEEQEVDDSRVTDIENARP